MTPGLQKRVRRFVRFLFEQRMAHTDWQKWGTISDKHESWINKLRYELHPQMVHFPNEPSCLTPEVAEIYAAKLGKDMMRWSVREMKKLDASIQYDGYTEEAAMGRMHFVWASEWFKAGNTIAGYKKWW